MPAVVADKFHRFAAMFGKHDQSRVSPLRSARTVKGEDVIFTLHFVLAERRIVFESAGSDRSRISDL